MEKTVRTAPSGSPVVMGAGFNRSRSLELRSVRIPSLVTLVLLAITLPGFVPPLQGQDCITEGKELLKKARLPEALASFDRCKRQDANNAEAYFYSGIGLLAAENRVEAAAELGKAVELAPERGDFALAYADALQGLGQRIAALETLKLFEEDDYLEQLDQDKLWVLSDLYQRLEELDQSLRVLDVLAGKGVEDPALPFRRGEIHLEASNLEAALEAFQKAAQEVPEAGPPHFGVGLVLRLQNKFEASREAFLRALKYEPNNPEYLWQLAAVSLALDRPQEAIERLEGLEESAEVNPDIYRVLGQAHLRLGNQERGQQYLSRYQQLQTSRQEQEGRTQQAFSLIARGEEKLQAGEVDAARRLFEDAVNQAPDLWVGHSYLAKIYLSSGFPRLAYQHLVIMMELAPKSAEGNFLMSRYWYENRNYQKAQEYAEAAKRLYPGSGALRNLLGNIYVALGQREKAVEEYAAAVQLEPERSDFRTNYDAIKSSLAR